MNALLPETIRQASVQAALVETAVSVKAAAFVDAFEDAKQPDALRSNLRASCEEGIAFGGMVGLGETYFTAFALIVGLGEISAGLIASVPLAAGGLLQLVSPYAISMLKSHRKWVLACAIAQALSFVPLIIAASVGSISTTLMLFVVSCYWAAGLATGPAWNTWMGTLVPQRIRAPFLACRTKWSSGAVFVGILAGGIALEVATFFNCVLATFVLMFSLAAGCRLVSAWCLYRQTEPMPLPVRKQRLTYRELFRKLRTESGGRILIYLIAVQASVQLSSPYFTPYMFKKLNFSYSEFVFYLSISFLARIVSLSLWGRVAKQLGALRLMWIGGLGIVPMSGAWIISHHFLWLTFIQIAAGALWGAYELAFGLMFLESIPDEDRTEMLTVYNLANTFAWVGGALVGAVILSYFNASVNGYLFLFGASSVLRLGCLYFLMGIQHTQSSIGESQVHTRSHAVRVNAASLELPLLPGKKKL